MPDEYQGLGAQRAQSTWQSPQPRPVPIPLPHKENHVSTPMPVAAKPATLTIDPNELQAAATVLGIPVAEVIDIQDHEYGPVIYTRDGGSYIIVDPAKPDELGQSGVLIFETATWHPVSSGFKMSMSVFADPDKPQFASASTRADLWTLDELITVGESTVSLNTSRNLYPEILAEGDPRRAMGLLSVIAKRLPATRRGAVAKDPTARQAWNVIVGSGWLAEGEAGKL